MCTEESELSRSYLAHFRHLSGWSSPWFWQHQTSRNAIQFHISISNSTFCMFCGFTCALIKEVVCQDGWSPSPLGCVSAPVVCGADKPIFSPLHIVISPSFWVRKISLWMQTISLISPSCFSFRLVVFLLTISSPLSLPLVLHHYSSLCLSVSLSSLVCGLVDFNRPH